MLTVRNTLVPLAAILMAPVAHAAVDANHVRMQDFVTVQSQQSTTNYTDRYTMANGKVTSFELAPVAASVTPVDQGGVLHVATRPPGASKYATPREPQARPGRG